MKTEPAPSLSPTEGQPRRDKKRRRHRKPVPQRTCVGCRAVNPKREMVRLVRQPDGRVEIDQSGKQPGRGTYLCQQRSCWEKALKHRSLEHALKVTLDAQTTASLVAYAQALPEHQDPAAKISALENS